MQVLEKNARNLLAAVEVAGYPAAPPIPYGRRILLSK